jgi:two-component sensor histidine kinase
MLGTPEPWSVELQVLPRFADGIIAVSLLLMAAALLYVYRRRGDRAKTLWPVALGVLALVAVALVHAALALGPLLPALAASNILKIVAAGLVLAAAIAAWRLVPRLISVPTHSQLESEVSAHLEAQEALRAARLQLDARASERKASEDQLHLLLRELTHRSKNLLAVISAIARQTAARTTSVDEFLKRFSARLYAIGSSHDLLIADDWHGASLRTLVEQQLETHADGFGTRIAIEGEDIVLKPEAVHNLGLALHELAANAEKFGSLSDPKGGITINWDFCDDAEALKLVWQETGGPEVHAPERSGFGRAMLENVVGKALAGDVTLSFPAEGVHCEIVIPASHVTTRGEASAPGG